MERNGNPPIRILPTMCPDPFYPTYEEWKVGARNGNTDGKSVNIQALQLFILHMGNRR
nr:hypothetical protein [Petrotoga halophila]